jgi:hypothetical protein
VARCIEVRGGEKSTVLVEAVQVVVVLSFSGEGVSTVAAKRRVGEAFSTRNDEESSPKE